MRPVLLAAACVALLTPMALAEPPLPRFEDFPAGPAFHGRNRLVLEPRDRAFRTRLRDAAEEAPNFAGHYVVTQWGCGTECVMGAAVDVRSGRVVWLPGTLCCWFADGATPDTVPDPLRYRRDSRLIVLNGRRDEREGDAGDHYYVIDGARFAPLRDVPPRPVR